MALRITLRGGSHSLETAVARRTKRGTVPPPWEERTCQVCNTGEPEDVEHFLLSCPGLARPRRGMIQAAEAAVVAEGGAPGQVLGLAKRESMRVLMGAEAIKLADGSSLKISKRLDHVVLRGVLRMHRARAGALRTA